MRGWIAGVVLLAACAVPLRVEMLGPDFTGARTVRMRGNVLPTPVDGIGAIELNAERVERPEEPFEYALLVEVRADGLRVRPGASLRLLVNGDSTLLRRDSVSTSWPRVDPTVREQARYPVSDSLLLSLAEATEVRVAVRGAAWWEQRGVSAQNLEVLREWVGTYVTEDSVGRGERVRDTPADRRRGPG